MFDDPLPVPEPPGDAEMPDLPNVDGISTTPRRSVFVRHPRCVSARHSFLKSSGWIFLPIFSTMRVISCSAQIATITAKSDTPATIAIITGLLGLSPLLLATLGILSRVYYSFLKTPWNMIFSFFVVKVVQVPTVIALILGIVGATSANNFAEVQDQDTIKASVIIYLVVFILLCVLALGATCGIRITGRGENRLLHAVVITLPIILIRIIYSMLSTFSNKPNFSAISGSTAATLIELFMVRIEEMLVVLIYLWAGFKQETVPLNEDGKEMGKIENLKYRAKRGDFGAGKLGIASLAAHAAFEICSPKKAAADERAPDQQLDAVV